MDRKTLPSKKHEQCSQLREEDEIKNSKYACKIGAAAEVATTNKTERSKKNILWALTRANSSPPSMHSMTSWQITNGASLVIRLYRTTRCPLETSTYLCCIAQ